MQGTVWNLAQKQILSGLNQAQTKGQRLVDPHDQLAAYLRTQISHKLYKLLNNNLRCFRGGFKNSDTETNWKLVYDNKRETEK